MNESELNVLKGIVVSLLTAAGKIVVEKIFFRRRAGRKLSLLSEMKSCIDDCELLITMGDVERVTVLKMTRVLSLESILSLEPAYSISMLYQVKSTKYALEDVYEDLTPDDSYVKMVNSLSMNIPFIVTKESIKDKTILGGIYRAIGVKYSEIYLVKKTMTECFFISFATANNSFTKKETDERIRLCIEKLNSILNKF